MTEKELTAHDLAIKLLEGGEGEECLTELDEVLVNRWDVQFVAAYFLTKCRVPEKAHLSAKIALIEFFISWGEDVEIDGTELSLAIEALRKFKAVPELKKAFLESGENSDREYVLEFLLKEMGEEIPEREKKSV